MRSGSYPHQWKTCRRPVIPATEKTGKSFSLIFFKNGLTMGEKFENPKYDEAGIEMKVVSILIKIMIYQRFEVLKHNRNKRYKYNQFIVEGRKKFK